MTPEALDTRLAGCCGRSLVAAHYHQIESESDDCAMHDIHPEIGDFCDFGVSLALDDDTVAYVAWDETFCQYGLMLTRTSTSDFTPEGNVFNRTDHPPWKDLMADPIKSARVIWDDFDGAPCPQAFHFSFASSRQLLLSAAQPMTRPNGKVELIGISDWVAVLHCQTIIESHLQTLGRLANKSVNRSGNSRQI